jgi:hypothetical protein
MRIHFGIKHGRNIKWPEKCLWCNAKPIKWQEYRKRTLYELKYLIIWTTIRSRKITIYYPICRKHDLISDLLRPSRLALFSLPIMFATISVPELKWLLVIPLAGYFYYRRHGLIIHFIGDHHVELSIPDGEYAEEFGLLNNCNQVQGNILMQD